jgi:hypothetical protein
MRSFNTQNIKSLLVMWRVNVPPTQDIVVVVLLADGKLANDASNMLFFVYGHIWNINP